MKRTYVSTRRELTTLINQNQRERFTCFRVRVACNCQQYTKHPSENFKANQRNGVLVVMGSNVVKIIIKCKICATNQNTIQ